MSTSYSIKAEIDYSTGSAVYAIVNADGRQISRTTYRTEAEAQTAAVELAAAADRRLAVIATYEAAGMQVVRGTMDRTAARYRKMRHILVIDAAGEPVAEYDSIDDVPALEAPATETAEVETAEVEQAEVVEATRVRGTITDAQADAMLNLIADDAHMGLHLDVPTDPTTIYALSREDAARYIAAMTEEN